jgi:hypothetical protein
MEEKELSLVIWSWGILLGVVGFLIVFAGSLLGYMLKQHREDNDSEHDEIKEELSEMKKDVKSDISGLHKRIDNVLIGE